MLSKFFNRIGDILGRLRDQIKRTISRAKVELSNFLLKKPSKRTLLLILTALCLLLVFLFYLVVPLSNKPTKTKNKPRFLFDITKGKNNLKGPLGVATAKDRVYIADSGNGRVVVVDLEGKYLYAFNVLEKESKKSSYPVGITVDDSGQIYVSDLYAQVIKVFNSNGKYLKDFPRNKALVERPLALTYAKSKIHVTDIGDQTVKIFDRGGKLLSQFGRPGKGDRQFAYPNSLAVTEDGTILVADSNNSRVQVFDSQGKLLHVFSKDLVLPKGIVVDKQQRVHVTDALSRKVFVFNKKGNFLFSYGRVSLGRDLAVPTGIAVNNEMRKFFITDRGKNCVSVWGY